MGKTLEDLANDKPEDIRAELEARAKEQSTPRVPEIPVVEPEETEQEEAEADNSEAGTPDKGETPATETAEDEGESGSEPDPLLERLTAKHGIKHNFKDADALLEGYANARRKLSERDEDAVLGRTLKALGVTDPGQLAGLVGQPEQPRGKKPSSGWSPPHEWNPAWDRIIKVVQTDDGEEYQGPPDEVRKFKEYEAYARGEMRQFQADPPGTIMRWLQDQVRGLAQEELSRTAGRQQYDTYMQENGEFIADNRAQIATLMDKGFSAYAAVEHAKLLKEHEAIKTSTTGAEAKKADLKKLAAKAKRRTGAATTPAKAAKQLTSVPTREALEIIAAEKGLDIPEAW